MATGAHYSLPVDGWEETTHRHANGLMCPKSLALSTGPGNSPDCPSHQTHNLTSRTFLDLPRLSQDPTLQRRRLIFGEMEGVKFQPYPYRIGHKVRQPRSIDVEGGFPIEQYPGMWTKHYCHSWVNIQGELTTVVSTAPIIRNLKKHSSMIM